MSDLEKALIWPEHEKAWPVPESSLVRIVSLRSGGTYAVPDQLRAAHPLNKLARAVAVRLTTWVLDQNNAGSEFPLIDEAVLARVRAGKPLGVEDRLARLLRACRAVRPRFGQEGLAVTDRFLAASECVIPAELLALWYNAKRLRLVDVQEYLPELEDGGVHAVSLTYEGHDWLEKRDAANADSGQGFVAMWFDPSMDEAFSKGFEPAITDAGYRPMRVDNHEYAGKIDDEVIAQIRRSRFVVADLTSGMGPTEPIARGSVYYEAGFAAGLGLPVIWTRRHDMPEVHFDVRQYNFIVWADAPDLRAQLSARISAILGDGPYKNL